jgi:hypothetical protein
MSERTTWTAFGLLRQHSGHSDDAELDGGIGVRITQKF